MKRSEINAIIKDAIDFLGEHKFLLPPFAYFSPEEWKDKNHEYDEIRNNVLGWDITDFGSGDFNKCGLFLFTLRNGNMFNDDDQKVYAEKMKPIICPWMMWKSRWTAVITPCPPAV